MARVVGANVNPSQNNTLFFQYGAHGLIRRCKQRFEQMRRKYQTGPFLRSQILRRLGDLS